MAVLYHCLSTLRFCTGWNPRVGFRASRGLKSSKKGLASEAPLISWGLEDKYKSRPQHFSAFMPVEDMATELFSFWTYTWSVYFSQLNFPGSLFQLLRNDVRDDTCLPSLPEGWLEPNLSCVRSRRSTALLRQWDLAVISWRSCAKAVSAWRRRRFLLFLTTDCTLRQSQSISPPTYTPHTPRCACLPYFHSSYKTNVAGVAHQVSKPPSMQELKTPLRRTNLF